MIPAFFVPADGPDCRGGEDRADCETSRRGAFLSPIEIYPVVKKAESAGGKKIAITERGTTFGYNNLVADMRSIPIMLGTGCPVIFDATHSVQRPGAGGTKSDGDRLLAPVLARAAIAAGATGVFIETHPNPDVALSDGPNMIPLAKMAKLLDGLVKLHRLTLAIGG